MSVSGIDVRQSLGRIVFRELLQGLGGALVVSGTTELRLFELQDDGTLKVFDWTTFAFVAAGAGTPDDETVMTHRQRRDSSGADVDTGIWTATLTNLAALKLGNVYIAEIYNAAALPQIRMREFQFGGLIGDSVYRARVYYRVDATNAVESYCVAWDRDGVPVAPADVGTPTIRVQKKATGANLIAASAMAVDAGGALLRYDATGAALNTSGDVLLVTVSGVIDGVTRTDVELVGRDL